MNGPKEWQIVTAPPGPICFVTTKKPDFSVGARAVIVLEILDDDVSEEMPETKTMPPAMQEELEDVA